jgi:hypothetical protein
MTCAEPHHPGQCNFAQGFDGPSGLNQLVEPFLLWPLSSRLTGGPVYIETAPTYTMPNWTRLQPESAHQLLEL